MNTKRVLEYIFLLSCTAYTRKPVGKAKLNRIKNIRKLLVDFEREARLPWWKKREPINLPLPDGNVHKPPRELGESKGLGQDKEEL